MNTRTMLGLVGCLVLGDEMAYVLENDSEIENILIVENKEGEMFREKLDPAATGQYVRLVDGSELSKMDISGLTVVVWVRGASLHDDPPSLLESLASSIHALEAVCGSVLLFYGMCRNTKYELKRFVEGFDVPVTFLTDADGAVVDDCFAAVMGGREPYLEMIRKNKCTMFLTTGYAEYWAMRQEGKGLEALVQQFENYQFLFKTLGYNKAMLLDTGLGDREEFRERARVFSSLFDLTVETTRCDTTLFERSYRLAWSKMPVTSKALEAGKEVALSRTLP
jgi:Protein of unknown function (DUF1638)